MRILRVLRGILKTALTWSIIWVPVSLIPFGIATLFGAAPSARLLGALMLSQAFVGAVNGAAFATLLAIGGRRKTFENLSMPWIASVGAIGGVLFPVGVRAMLGTTVGISLQVSLLGLVTNAVLGASCAVLTLSVARRAPALRSGEDDDTLAFAADGMDPQLEAADLKADATARQLV